MPSVRPTCAYSQSLQRMKDQKAEAAWVADRGSPSRNACGENGAPSATRAHGGSGVLRLGEPRSAEFVHGPCPMLSPSALRGAWDAPQSNGVVSTKFPLFPTR